MQRHCLYLCMMVALLITILLLSVCGGGSGSTCASEVAVPAAQSPVATSNGQQRSMKVNNYGNWHFTSNGTHERASLIRTVASHDYITITERFRVNPDDIRAINPAARIYLCYALCVKCPWDPDYTDPLDTSRQQTPMSRQVIDANGWWLRDAKGEIIMLGETPMLDVGKQGFKEAYLSAVLTRNENKRFDGFLFDYWWNHLPLEKGTPRPLAYPTDNDWYRKAWQPFIKHVMTGLRAAGYRVIGNCAGQYGSPDHRKNWQRQYVDGTVYEQWATGWSGEWLSGAVIQERIRAFSQDPLETWAVDGGSVQPSDPGYLAKKLLHLAMYYIAIPSSPQNHSFCIHGDGKVNWDPLYDFSIGTPSGPAMKIPGKYFWSRKFSKGIVLFNYEDQDAVKYTLDGSFRDVQGEVVTGEVTLQPRTALILGREDLK